MVRFPKLHIKPFKLFEGSCTFTNPIEPLLPKNELNSLLASTTTLPIKILCAQQIMCVTIMCVTNCVRRRAKKKK